MSVLPQHEETHNDLERSNKMDSLFRAVDNEYRLHAIEYLVLCITCCIVKVNVNVCMMGVQGDIY